MRTHRRGNRIRVDYNRVMGACWLSALLLVGQSPALLANPTGGAVVAGAATIGAAGKTLTINQSTNSAIINWQTFSIASGETTKFVVPSSMSSTLNYVLSGNPSAIYGTLSSNGKVFLINPSGILVGASGRIDTAGFLGSTLNPNSSTGTLVFSGSSTASIDNQGSISASSGNVYLIASHVSNEGTLSAPQGEVGLAAGSTVLLQQAGDEHLFVQSNPIGTQRAVGVSNAGTIKAATVELKAAGGNAYALAINNTGSIAATGFKKINGQVYLTADTGVISNSGSISATGSAHGGTIKIASQTGTVTNSGIIDASATGTGGQGGSVSLTSAQGEVVNTGDVYSQGGAGGAGGDVDISGSVVDVESGVVNTLALDGTPGMFTLDPITLTVAPSGGDDTGAYVESQLALGDFTLEGDNTVTIEDNITWTAATTLTLQTTAPGGAILIDSPISGVNGGLTLDATPLTGIITTSNAGTVDVNTFTLENGTWNQIVGQNGLTVLPAFSTFHFHVQNLSTFERFAGGDGSDTPFEITDVYGLEGIDSPSGALLGDSFVLDNDIDASAAYHGGVGLGFRPIGNGTTAFTGTFNGNDFTISNLTVNDPTNDYSALFGETSSTALIENVNLTAETVTGVNAAGLVAINYGLIENSSASGTVTGATTSEDVGGLVAQNWGVIYGSSSGGSVVGGANSEADGGLVGSNIGGIELSFSTANVSGSNDVGGLVGYNYYNALIDNSYDSGSVTGVSGADNVGGIVGYNYGTVESSYTTSPVNGSGSTGGLAGDNGVGGSVVASYWATDAGTNGSLSTAGTDNGTVDEYTSGQTLSALADQSTFQPTGSGAGEWDFGTTWTTNDNTTTPELIGNGANNSGGGGNTGGGGYTPPVNLIDLASIDDGSGSNLVPVSTIPQNGDVSGGDNGSNSGGSPGDDFGGADQSGSGNGGLANSSGNGGLIGPGDSGVLGGGALGNFSNPAVYSAFGNALGPIVYTDLSAALGLDNGGYYPNDAKPGNGEATVDAGDCIVIENGKIQNVNPNQVPGPLKDALGNGTFQNMPGH